MAVDRPVWIFPYTVAGVISAIRVSGTGKSTPIATTEIVKTTTYDKAARKAAVWDGNIMFPGGSNKSHQQGYLGFNPRLNKFEWLNLMDCSSYLVPLADKILWETSAAYQSLDNPRYSSVTGGAPANAGARYDAIAHEGYVYITLDTALANGLMCYQYPFTAPPSLTTAHVTRFAKLNGTLYGLEATNAATFYLRSTAMAWAHIGAGWANPDVGNYQTTYRSIGSAFFGYNGKLWQIAAYNSGSTSKYRAWSIDPATGAGTVRDDILPAWMKTAEAANHRAIFEVVDNAGTVPKVYVIPTNSDSGGWVFYEMTGTVGNEVLSEITSGADRIDLHCGVVWDDDAQSCHVDSASDSAPSSHATVDHRVADRANNLVTDIDIKYKRVGQSEAEPYNDCTRKVAAGGDGTTSLATAPSGYSALPDLDDAFSAGAINEELWEKVNPSLTSYLATKRDYSTRYQTVSQQVFHSIAQTGGAILFGSDAAVPPATLLNGVGLRCKWPVNGAFQVDLTIANMGNLVAAADSRFGLWAYVKCGTDRGYAIKMWRDSGAGNVVKARGLSFAYDANASESADGAHNLVNGETIRIARDAANAWTLNIDQSGVPESVLPTVTPAYSEDVCLWIFGLTETGNNFASGGDGPGFSQASWGGAGALGKYDGSVSYQFMWDHVTDLGSGFNGSIEIFTDTT
jgi:hypothetical protein